MAYDFPSGRSPFDSGPSEFDDAEPSAVEAEPFAVDVEPFAVESEPLAVEIEVEMATDLLEDDGDIDIALLDQIERELADVELALERLGEGSYGKCETCGQVLSDEELEKAPAGRFCRAHLPLDIS